MATRHPSIVAALNLVLIETGCDKTTAMLIVVNGLVKAGVPIQKATDAVVGPGTYQQISDMTWEALQPA